MEATGTSRITRSSGCFGTRSSRRSAKGPAKFSGSSSHANWTEPREGHRGGGGPGVGGLTAGWGGPQNGQNEEPNGAIRPHDVHTRDPPVGPTIPGIPTPGLHAIAIAP